MKQSTFLTEKWKLPGLILFLLYWCGCVQKESMSHLELGALVSVAWWVETVTFLEPRHEGCRPLSPPWKLWMVNIWKMFIAGVADNLASWLNQEMRKDLTPLLWWLWVGWEASPDPETAFSSMCAHDWAWAKDLTCKLSNVTNPEQ